MADKPDDRPVRSFGVAMPMYWMFQLAFSGRHKAIVNKTVEDTRPDPVVVVVRCIKSARTHLSEYRQTVGTDAGTGESGTNYKLTEGVREFRQQKVEIPCVFQIPQFESTPVFKREMNNGFNPWLSNELGHVNSRTPSISLVARRASKGRPC